MEGKPEVEKSGYHFYSKIQEIPIPIYPIDLRIVKIRAYGDIDASNHIYSTNKIEILKELFVSSEDKIRYVHMKSHHLSDEEAKELFSEPFVIDDYINDSSFAVRAIVARLGYGLDKLADDKEPYVKKVVAEQGYGLDKLVNDPDEEVRAAVAEQGYGLDKLVNDEAWQVRIAVAGQGYGLDKLVNDPDEEVRAIVAEQGYGLDKLIYDENISVEIAVLTYISRNNKGLIDKISAMIGEYYNK